MIHYRSDDYYEKLNKVKEILEEYKTQGRYKDTLKELSISSNKKKRYSRTLEEPFTEYLIKHDLLDIEALDKAIEDFTESLKNKTYTQIGYSSISDFINPYYVIKKGLLTIEECNKEMEGELKYHNCSFESEKDIIDYYGKINSFESYVNKAINTIIYKFRVSKITQKYVEIERDSCLFFNDYKYSHVDFSYVYYSKFKIPKDLFSKFYELSLNEPVLIVLEGKHASFIDFETFEKLEPLFQKYLKIYNYKEDFDYEDDDEEDEKIQNKISKYFLYKMSLKYLQSIQEVKKNLEKDIDTLVSKYNNLDYPK